MRYFYLFFFIISFLGNTSWAQDAILQIHNLNNVTFDLEINGTAIAPKESRSIQIDGLQFEIYRLKISSPTQSNEQLVYLRKGKTTSYILENNFTLTKYDSIIPNLTAYNYISNINKDSLSIAQKPKQSITPKVKTEQVVKKSTGWNLYPTEETNTLPDSIELKTDHLQFENSELQKTSSGPCNKNLDSKELKKIRTKMRIIKTPSQQQAIVLKDLEGTCITVDQLKDLYKEIEEDEIKTSLFKSLYTQIMDIENIALLYDSFLFEFSIEEIIKYAPED